VRILGPEKLKRTFDPTQFSHESRVELAGFLEILAQERGTNSTLSPIFHGDALGLPPFAGVSGQRPDD
jgi:hypothetical protein